MTDLTTPPSHKIFVGIAWFPQVVHVRFPRYFSQHDSSWRNLPSCQRGIRVGHGTGEPLVSGLHNIWSILYSDWTLIFRGTSPFGNFFPLDARLLLQLVSDQTRQAQARDVSDKLSWRTTVRTGFSSPYINCTPVNSGFADWRRVVAAAMFRTSLPIERATWYESPTGTRLLSRMRGEAGTYAGRTVLPELRLGGRWGVPATIRSQSWIQPWLENAIAVSPGWPQRKGPSPTNWQQWWIRMPVAPATAWFSWQVQYWSHSADCVTR